jgi:hypothetical protein
MNQLVGDGGGFSVGHTVQSHTQGIWLASQAVEGYTPDGQPVRMLFMDSEGLGANDKVRRGGGRGRSMRQRHACHCYLPVGGVPPMLTPASLCVYTL